MTLDHPSSDGSKDSCLKRRSFDNEAVIESKLLTEGGKPVSDGMGGGWGNSILLADQETPVR